MLVVLGIVPAVIGEGPLAVVPVEVLDLVGALGLGQDGDRFLIVCLRKPVVCPKNPLTTATWSCVSMVGTGSSLAENSKSVK